MYKLNSKAAGLAGKYIKKSDPLNIMDSRKMRGLQAEINKMNSIKNVILNNRIENKELLRLRTEVNKLVYIIDSKLSGDDII